MKKKTTTKKAPAKKATKKTTAFDDALTPPASKAVVAVEPMEVTMDEQIEGGEPWPNYSPFSEDEDTGPGFSPANIAPVTEKVDEVVDSWDDVYWKKDDVTVTEGKTHVFTKEPALGSGSPVEASDPLSGTNMPADASKTVTDLIDGMNYLYKLAVTIRGPRGLKQHDESILKKRVAAGRQLLASLKV